jgi:hypothetical protein
MLQVQKGWTEIVESWMRVDQRMVGKDSDGHDVLEITETPITRVKATCINNDGSEIACYATNPKMLEGLKRLHVFAAGR